jgi:hypothetical protein
MDKYDLDLLLDGSEMKPGAYLDGSNLVAWDFDPRYPGEGILIDVVVPVQE